MCASFDDCNEALPTVRKSFYFLTIFGHLGGVSGASKDIPARVPSFHKNIASKVTSFDGNLFRGSKL